jgi:1-acyl-sn-glycerol-3-phosphate acyltransferase
MTTAEALLSEGGKFKRAGFAYLVRSGCLAYEYFVFYFGFLYFGVGCAVISGLSVLLRPLLPRRFGLVLGRWMTGMHFRGFLAMLKGSGLLHIDLVALDQLRGEPSLIIAPNHPSMLDAIFIISRLPQIACILKSQIWDSFFLGGGARLSAYIRNDAPVSLVRQSAKELLAGHQLLVFPEGTRTREPPINAFRGGVGLIAKRSGAVVQTVFIETNSAFLSKDWPVFAKPRFPLIYRARLGNRYAVEGDVKTFVAELEYYYRRELPDIRHSERAGRPRLDRGIRDDERKTAP